jgi:hypothetical protein
VEVFVIIGAAICGWVCSDQFNQVKLSNDRLFDQFIDSDFVSAKPWLFMIFLSTLWALFLLIILVITQLIFQKSPPLLFFWDVLVLAIMFNFSDVRSVTCPSDRIKTEPFLLHYYPSNQRIAQLFSITASRIFGLMFWYCLMPGLSGAILFFISLSAYNALMRTYSLETVRRSQCLVVTHFMLAWLPHRCLGLTYALVGDFETAMRCWRDQGGQSGLGLWRTLLSASGGALNMQFGGASTANGKEIFTPKFGISEHLILDQAATRSVAFFLRSFLLWLFVLFIVDILI